MLEGLHLIEEKFGQTLKTGNSLIERKAGLLSQKDESSGNGRSMDTQEKGGSTERDAGGEQDPQRLVDPTFLLTEAGRARGQGEGMATTKAEKPGNGATVGEPDVGTKVYDFRTSVRKSVEIGAVMGHEKSNRNSRAGTRYPGDLNPRSTGS